MTSTLSPADLLEWEEYGQHGIDASYPGHPRSGRCLHCTGQIAGEPLRVGKWIYCDVYCHDARLLVVPVLETGCGATYLPGDVVEPGDGSSYVFYGHPVPVGRST